MARPRKCRRVAFLPGVTHFKPAGIPLQYLEEIVLSVEELEAIRLRDREGLEQEECAQRMGVSRPTFARILDEARRKLADALIDGKAIRIEGGDFQLTGHGMPMRQFACVSCGHRWEEPFGSGRCGRQMTCPRCASAEIGRTDHGPYGEHGRHRRRGGAHPVALPEQERLEDTTTEES